MKASQTHREPNLVKLVAIAIGAGAGIMICAGVFGWTHVHSQDLLEAVVNWRAFDVVVGAIGLAGSLFAFLPIKEPVRTRLAAGFWMVALAILMVALKPLITVWGTAALFAIGAAGYILIWMAGKIVK